MDKLPSPLPFAVTQPLPRPPPAGLERPAGALCGVRSDHGLAQFLTSSLPGTAVVEYGTAWCAKCHEMFPQLLQLTKRVRTIACNSSTRADA
jgi:thiol-disulfide isomerase/thioredoxin